MEVIERIKCIDEYYTELNKHFDIGTSYPTVKDLKKLLDNFDDDDRINILSPFSDERKVSILKSTELDNEDGTKTNRLVFVQGKVKMIG